MPTTSFTSDGTIFVTDPLTTIFTPPASCSNPVYTSIESGGRKYYQRDLALQKSRYGPLGPRSDCFWPHAQFHHSPGVKGVYSPGVCPSNYTANQILIGGSPATTTAWCCPYGFDLDVSLGGGCTSLVTTPTTVALNSEQFPSISDDFTAVDYYVFIQRAESDLAKFTPSGAPTQARMTDPFAGSGPPPTNGATPKNPAASNTGAAGSNGGGGDLSSGAEAGIGVGVVIAVLAITALAAWLLSRRRKRRQQFGKELGGYESRSALEQVASAYTESGDGYYTEGSWPPGSRLVEADGSSRIEVEVSPWRRAELEDDSHIHELDNSHSSQS